MTRTNMYTEYCCAEEAAYTLGAHAECLLEMIEEHQHEGGPEWTERLRRMRDLMIRVKRDTDDLWADWARGVGEIE